MDRLFRLVADALALLLMCLFMAMLGLLVVLGTVYFTWTR